MAVALVCIAFTVEDRKQKLVGRVGGGHHGPDAFGNGGEGGVRGGFVDGVCAHLVFHFLQWEATGARKCRLMWRLIAKFA